MQTLWVMFPPYKIQLNISLLTNVLWNLFLGHQSQETSQIGSMEFIFRPSILGNITNWRAFDYDQKIIMFHTSEDTFKGFVIDE